MARRSKIPPTTRKISVGGNGGFAGWPTVIPNGWIDIAQCLSIMNRRAYRQGMEYYVDSWSLTSAVPCQAYIVTLDETWVNCNAWTKAFHTWLESQEQVEDFDDIKGRYHDFKVFMTHTHATKGVGDNLLPYDINPAAVTAVSASAGVSWDASEIQIPNVGGSGNTVGFEMHMVGADGNSKGIVEGYANSRARPQATDPNTLQGTYSWMTEAFNVGENLGEIITDLTYENDSPPYFLDEDTAFEFYPGGSNATNGCGEGTTASFPLAINPIVGSHLTKHGPGFVAPCGLVLIVGPVDVDFQVTLNVALGPYKGVMARPMQDVN